jgi:hypothetical protein
MEKWAGACRAVYSGRMNVLLGSDGPFMADWMAPYS